MVSETMTDPLVGQVVDGRYLVLRRLAVGGMATVYVAQDRRLGREIALKVMSPALLAGGEGSDFAARFRREARSAARLTHPGTVRVYDQGSDGDISYLTMELVEGASLRTRLQRDATLPLGETLVLMDRVLDALGAAHRKGLVHRDVKPENILIDVDGNPKVADFGLTRAVTDATSASTGTVLGTVAYLAPEVIRSGTADARADVFAAGVVLYECVTGRTPFTGGSAIEVATRAVHEDAPPPSEHVPWLPPEIDELFATLAARDPELRPADANDALALVRRTRTMIDDPTLSRKADPPSGAIPLVPLSGDTEVIGAPIGGAGADVGVGPATGSTVALPIGLGEERTAPMPRSAEVVPVGVEDYEDERRRGFVGWWIGAAVAAIAILSVLGVWWYNSYGPGAYTTVPAVAGSTAAEARVLLEDQDFEVALAEVFDDVYDPGIVVGAEPGEGERVAKGGEVTLLVSKGPRMEFIPTVVGIDEADALSALAQAGFPEPDITHEYSDDVPEGEVMSATPNEGEEVRHDTKVALLISQGPEPITIPNVVGKSESKAKEALGKFALDVAVVRERTTEAPKGEVFKQDPAGNAAGYRTQEITIWVSDGPPLVEVGYYIFKNLDDAVAEAEGLGLVVEVHPRYFWQSRNSSSIVQDQSIDPGTKVEMGTTITLTFTDG